jgi:4'-phosphopantetheinyl transferase
VSIASLAWQSPPAGLALGAADVDVWRVALAASPDQLASFTRTLSDDERDRAARFHFERDRMAFIAARGALRTLVAHYTDCTPGSLVFAARTRGKPYLDAPRSDLRFNLSHSGGVGLLAFARGAEIGVDVECQRPLEDLLSLAKISFSAHEYAALCRIAPIDREAAFFACWARKEAFIKATGEGIAQLADFDVSLAPGIPARLLRIKDVAPADIPWSIHDLPPIAGYATALVVERHGASIRCWDGRCWDGRCWDGRPPDPGRGE